MALSDVKAKNAKAGPTPYKLTDGAGMYLQVQPSGAKYWRINYRFAGKQKTLALGSYPEVSLASARQKRAEARELLAQHPPVDPMEQRNADKRTATLLGENTFENIACEWWESKRGAWSPGHAADILTRLKKDVFPSLGARPIAGIEAPDLLTVIRAIEKRDALETARKTLSTVGQVFRYAIITGRAKGDVSRDLRGAIRTRKVRHHASLSEKELPEFLAKLQAYDGQQLTRLALTLLILTFVRSGELRGARWQEFDLEKCEWRVPAERMKMKVEHIVPLSAQAVKVIEEIRQLSGNREHVFPNEHNPKKFMSENTMLGAIWRMGYKGKATGHGFRGTASTILNEQGWNRDAIERQLAHSEKDSVRAAYNTAEYLPERRKMMQAWADYLEGKASGANVTPIRKQVA